MQEVILHSFSCLTYEKNNKEDNEKIDFTTHRHGRLEIVYVVKGKVEIKYISSKTGKTLKCSVKPKQFAIIRPECIHSLNFADKSVIMDVQFSGREGDIFEYLQNSEYLSKIDLLEVFINELKDVMVLIDTQNVRYALNKIKQYFAYNYKIYALDFVALDLEFASLLVEILKCYRNRMECAERNVYLRKALSCVNMYFSDPNLSVKDLARYSGVSEAYLQKLFQDDINCSVHDFLTEIRMSRAKNMILRTNFALTEIAKEVGYTSQQSFINNFRKTFGTTPESFKKEQNDYNDFNFEFIPPDYDKVLY